MWGCKADGRWESAIENGTRLLNTRCERQNMKTTQTDKVTPMQRVIAFSRNAMNIADADKAQAEHAALNAVAEIAQRESRVRLTSVEMDEALANLAAVRDAEK